MRTQRTGRFAEVGCEVAPSFHSRKNPLCFQSLDSKSNRQFQKLEVHENTATSPLLIATNPPFFEQRPKGDVVFRMERLMLGFLLLSFVFLTFFASGAHSQAASDGKGIAGRWEGALGGRLHLVLTISDSGSGDYSGTLNSVDQGAVLPMEAIKAEGDR